MTEIWNHWPGYSAACQRVYAQTREANLRVLDDLFGRGELDGQSDPEVIRAEALRQVEIEFRATVNVTATALVEIHRAKGTTP